MKKILTLTFSVIFILNSAPGLSAQELPGGNTEGKLNLIKDSVETTQTSPSASKGYSYLLKPGEDPVKNAGVAVVGISGGLMMAGLSVEAMKQTISRQVLIAGRVLSIGGAAGVIGGALLFFSPELLGAETPPNRDFCKTDKVCRAGQDAALFAEFSAEELQEVFVNNPWFEIYFNNFYITLFLAEKYPAFNPLPAIEAFAEKYAAEHGPHAKITQWDYYAETARIYKNHEISLKIHKSGIGNEAKVRQLLSR